MTLNITSYSSDELLYHARIHPEQYSNTLSASQIKQLHTSLHYVCGLAVSTLSDSSKYPEEWLFKHRWGKGKKDDPKKLPNGASIKHITVGGRTSAIVPNVQKKTGPIAGDLEGGDAEDGEANRDEEVKAKAKPRGSKGQNLKTKKEEIEDEEEAEAEPAPKTSTDRKRSIKYVEEEINPEAFDGDHHGAEEDKPPRKKRKENVKNETNSEVKTHKGKKGKAAGEEPLNGQRRSARASRNGR